MEEFPKLPIHKHFRFSVHSSRLTGAGSPVPDGMKSPGPRTLASKFHAQNPYIKDQWKTVDLSETPMQRDGSFFFDATPPVTPRKGPEASKAHVTVRRVSQNPLLRQDSSGNIEVGLDACRKEASDVDTKASSTPSTPNAGTDQNSYSWTRQDAQDARSSTTSSRFRNLTSWANGQKQRKKDQQVIVGRKKLLLKNQASKPVLAPQPQKAINKLSNKSRPSRIESSSSKAASMASPNAEKVLSPVEMTKISR